ncbi:MAG: hypothetical protein ACREID_00690 [Planctomycetota bacterium]
MTKTRLLCALAMTACGACGGGGGGGGGGNGPPPPGLATVVNTQLAIAQLFPNAASVGTVVLAQVSEREMGADLNADGDQNDSVVHRVETADGSTSNLAFATVGPILASDTHFLFLVQEAAQGNGDINADGDTGDAMWFVYDPSLPVGSGNPAPTGVVTGGAGGRGTATTGGFVLFLSEAATGQDRTADGDMLDDVLMTFDTTTFAVLFQAFALAPNTPLVARAGRVLVTIGEPAMGLDLNMDGDSVDLVLFVADFTQGAAMVRPVGGPTPRAISTHPYALTDGAAVYFIDEASEFGTSLNGDADATDAVIAVFDFAGGSGEMRPISPLVPGLALAGSTAVGIATGQARAVVGVDESAQNATDVNGDMDTSDAVLGWIDTAGAPGTMNLLLPLALAPVAGGIGSNRGVVAISEFNTGLLGTDFNGDGDVNDPVAFLLDTAAAPGTATTLGFAVATIALSGSDALLGIPEAQHQGIDLNSDSSIDDTVLFYFDVSDNPPTSRNLVAVSMATTSFRLAQDEVRIAGILAEGQSPAFSDLNGDGDLLDAGLVLLGVDPSVTPPGQRTRTPFSAGTATAFATPPLRAGVKAFAFPSAENLAGADFNGDGDMTDTVLRFVRYATP